MTVKGDKQLPNWSSRPEPAPDPAPKRDYGKYVARMAGYLVDVILFGVMTALVACIMMTALTVMHHEFWPVPNLGFLFCWAFVWGTSALALWYYQLLTREE
jgi:hypothetical protein